MNTSNLNEEPISLRQAVEEQLDLILKLQEDRKALKKQNKLLTQKISTLHAIAEKYQVQTSECGINTETIEPEKPKISQKGIQIELQNQININNISKLSEAKSLLKGLDFTETQLSESKIQPKKVKPSTKQISDEVVKMGKEINSLRRELKQSEHRVKGKDKEIRDLKKCLETKNQALEKSRKDFNELSILFNTDKYKSIRTLEGEIFTLKQKLQKQQSQQKLKQMLSELMEEYQSYKEQAQMRINQLTQQLSQ